MLLRQELDQLYAAFCETLPSPLQVGARELPYRLRMAISPEVPWSEVLGHEVTFAAPAVFSEAMPGIAPAKVRDAVLAHALAVIDGFGTDRLEDRQIPASAEIREILSHIRNARDRALARVASSTSREPIQFEKAQCDMLEAIHDEQRIMSEHGFADFAIYERIAGGKTAIGSPASVALARAAGWNEYRCHAVARALSAVWLGMQYHDDVLDWEDDFKRDSSWAVVLAREVTRGEATPRASGHESARALVFESGILAQMLERSFRYFRAARKRAEVLGARELAAWARTKEDYAMWLAQQERQNSGYAVRLQALSPWVTKVLS